MPFITDLGDSFKLTDDQGEVIPIGRYGVWKRSQRGKHEVVECGDDLLKLQEKHGPLSVYIL